MNMQEKQKSTVMRLDVYCCKGDNLRKNNSVRKYRNQSVRLFYQKALNNSFHCLQCHITYTIL